MSNMPFGGKGSDLAPGMTQVCYVGQVYHIEDESGQGIDIEPKNHEDVTKFLHAFDTWMMVKATMPSTATQVIESAWDVVVKTWHALPKEATVDFPSVRAGGIVIPGGHIRG